MMEEFLDIEMVIDIFRYKCNKDREYIFKEINKKKFIYFVEFELYSLFIGNK